MADINKVIKKIEQFAPLDTMQKWDNSGWQINLGHKETNKIMVTLDVTPETASPLSLIGSLDIYFLVTSLT